jgi:hypothetical protein
LTLNELTDRQAVLHAIAEFDELGRDAFLARYGFGRSYGYFLKLDGRRYDSKAIVGAAHGHQFPEQGPLRPNEFSGGNATVKRVLERMGFEVAQETGAERGHRQIADALQFVLEDYRSARESEQFGSNTEIWQTCQRLKEVLQTSPPVLGRPTLQVTWSVGQGNWARVPWIAFLDSRETDSTRHGVYCVYLFREDMSGVYLTFNQGVTRPKEEYGGARGGRRYVKENAERVRSSVSDQLQVAGFQLDDTVDLRATGDLGRDYEHSTIAHRLYSRDHIPEDEDLLRDLEAVLGAYDTYLTGATEPRLPDPPTLVVHKSAEFTLAYLVETLISDIGASGFVYEPWQIAAFVCAVRTKPFVILAGITGTGKSKLPELVARFTDGCDRTIPVRPDWTDSADVLGYLDLQGRFRPGGVLEVAKQARDDPVHQWFCVIDEMNLARVEQYFAEVLSRMEKRRAADTGGYETDPLLTLSLGPSDSDWSTVALPSNLAIVGTVNMDEASHTFSRKVLDRAFTLELSDVDLRSWAGSVNPQPAAHVSWPTSAWHPRAISLGSFANANDGDRAAIDDVIDVLRQANVYLSTAQLQVGYRTRDEIALFVLHASDLRDSFRDRDRNPVDPLDLALQMKILPRIVGGSAPIRQTLRRLLGWAAGGTGEDADATADELTERWKKEGLPPSLPDSTFPRTAARLCMMWDRLVTEGFTSFWL